MPTGGLPVKSKSAVPHLPTMPPKNDPPPMKMDPPRTDSPKTSEPDGGAGKQQHAVDLL